MALRLIETLHGTYFCCCASLFHGQVCPDCKTFYENPYETLRLQTVPVEPTKAPEGAQDEQTDQEGDTTQTDAPAATSETTTPSAETTAPTTTEEAAAAPVAKQTRKPKQS